MRYIVWAMQLALTLHFCGVDMLPVEYLIAIPFYYMVVAIFPSVPALNIAIRGTWSLIIFETFCDNAAGIALALKGGKGLRQAAYLTMVCGGATTLFGL